MKKNTDKSINYINIAKEVLEVEIHALSTLSEILNQNFNKAIDLILKCRHGEIRSYL